MSLRFSHIADIHLGSYQGKVETGGLNSRFIDFVKTFNEAIDKTIADDMDFCLIPGDIFKSKTPTPEETNEFAKGIMKLMRAKIPTVIVLGNHDLFLADNRSHSIGVFQTLLQNEKNFTISKTAEIIKLQTKSGLVQIQTMPYPIRSILKLERNEDVVKYIEETTARLYALLENDIPAIYAGHFTLSDAKIGDEKRYVDHFSEPIINTSIFKNKKYCYVAMGHIHGYQMVANNPPVVYAGSINRTDFNEASEDKGFIKVEIKSNKATFKFEPVSARKFVDLKYEFDIDGDPTNFIIDDINAKASSIKDSILRIEIILSEEANRKYDNSLVIDRLNELAYWIHGSCLPIVRKKSLIRENLGFSESMNELQALQHYANVNKIKNSDLFMKYGEKIIKESLEMEE